MFYQASFLLLTGILTAVKGKTLRAFCSSTSKKRCKLDVDLDSKELSENLKSQYFTKINSIKAYDFSKLYATIPHDKL